MKRLEPLAKEGKINEDASIRDRQSAIINAPIDKVWELLINVNEWSDWNPEIKDTKCDKVVADAAFEWTIRHTHMKSKFQVVNKPELLTWVGKSKFSKVIFVWNLEASDAQTIVTVEESVEGFVLPIFNNHSKLHDILVDWLQALKATAES